MRSGTRVLAGHKKRQRQRPAVVELRGWLLREVEPGLELGLLHLRGILDVNSGSWE